MSLANRTFYVVLILDHNDEWTPTCEGWNELLEAVTQDGLKTPKTYMSIAKAKRAIQYSKDYNCREYKIHRVKW